MKLKNTDYDKSIKALKKVLEQLQARLECEVDFQLSFASSAQKFNERLLAIYNTSSLLRQKIIVAIKKIENEIAFLKECKLLANPLAETVEITLPRSTLLSFQMLCEMKSKEVESMRNVGGEIDKNSAEDTAIWLESVQKELDRYSYLLK